MRCAIRRDLAHQTREMVIRTGRGESIDLDAARALDECQDDVLLIPTAVPRRNGNGWELCYGLEGCLSLRSFLRKGTMNEPWLVGILSDCACALARLPRLEQGRFPTLFELGHVFVDAQMRLRLAYVPVVGLKNDEGHSPLRMLMTLAKHEGPRHVSPSDRMLREALGRYVEGEREAFSLNHFRAFVRDATGVEVLANGVVKGSSHAKHDEYVLRDLTNGNTFCMREGSPMHLGRGDMCDVQLVGRPDISRDHASVCVEGDGVTLVDLGSTNGTYVRGRGLLPTFGMRIPIGQVFFLSGDRFCVERRWEEACCEW